MRTWTSTDFRFRETHETEARFFGTYMVLLVRLSLFITIYAYRFFFGLGVCSMFYCLVIPSALLELEVLPLWHLIVHHLYEYTGYSARERWMKWPHQQEGDEQTYFKPLFCAFSCFSSKWKEDKILTAAATINRRWIWYHPSLSSIRSRSLGPVMSHTFIDRYIWCIWDTWHIWYTARLPNINESHAIYTCNKLTGSDVMLSRRRHIAVCVSNGRERKLPDHPHFIHSFIYYGVSSLNHHQYARTLLWTWKSIHVEIFSPAILHNLVQFAWHDGCSLSSIYRRSYSKPESHPSQN